MFVGIMGERFATVLEWRGANEIGMRLASLIPNGISNELIEEKGGGDGATSLCKLQINVEADSLQELRRVVDELLALFSDQDQ